jgi:hypothetical protein
MAILRTAVRFLLPLSLLLHGCKTLSEPPRPVLQPTEQLPELVVDVALAGGDSERVEPAYVPPHPEPVVFYKTGEVWKRFFLGSPSRARSSLHITNGRLDWSNTLFTKRITYTVDTVLTYDAREFPLHAEGVGAYQINLEAAIGDAVYAAIASMEKQISAITADRASARPSVGDRLRELTRLYKEGLISEAEYEAKRRELLDSL